MSPLESIKTEKPVAKAITSPKLKICCIFNFGPHYRLSIYQKLEEQFDCSFYFGNKTFSKVKKLDYSLVKGKVEELKFIHLFSSFHWLAGAVRLCISKNKYFLITGEPYCLSTWGVLILNKIFGKKTYLWSHGWYGNESKVKSWVKKLFFGLSSGIFLYGNYAKKLMIKNGINAKKIHVIFNSLNYEKAFQIRKNLTRTNIYKEHFQNNAPTLLFIGRLEPNKKIGILLKAQQLYQDKFQLPINISIIGEGSEKENLIRKFGKSQNIWFYGACYDENKISELIYNADLCVSPGNIGLTAIHSLSYGTPLITHNNFANQMPEFETIENMKTGTFFKEDNVNSLVNIITKWLEVYPQKSPLIINNCFTVIDQKYNPIVQVEIMKSVIESS